MVVSIDEIVEKGSKLQNPSQPAKLGYFESLKNNENADNVFVLVVHYDFKGGKNDWPRPGDELDVQNLRKTFEEDRKCRFRECSPKKEDLLALLQDEKKLKNYFGANQNLELAIFFMIVLSHGAECGVIYTDHFHSFDSKVYETFTTKELFTSFGQVFRNSLKLVFLGPCRGQQEDSVFHPGQASDLTINQNSSRVSFEPKMRNLIIFYSTVETTRSCRDKRTGTWLVAGLCEELNNMKQNKSVVKVLTGVQNRIHQETTGPFRLSGQTPELKIFSCDRKFIFQHPYTNNTVARSPSNLGTDAQGKEGSPEEDKQRSITFEWWNSQTNNVLRGRRAVIFHQWEKNEYLRKLEAALVTNLGFETINAKIDAAGLEYYFKKSEKSWTDYGCFAVFFFAEIAEGDEQVCISLNENDKVPIGKLIFGLLGPKIEDWIGKPKLFFLIDTKSTDADSAGTSMPRFSDFLRATNYSGWLVFILQNTNLNENFLEIFQSHEIKHEKSLQDSLYELITELKKGASYQSYGTEAMMVSTLPHMICFQDLTQNFIQPRFNVVGKGFENMRYVDWEYLLESKQIKEEECIWLITSLPGSGKSTVMRELAFELQRRLKGEVKVYLVVLFNLYEHFPAKNNGKISLASIVSYATGTRELEIQNLIEQKKIMLIFDGFDEICPYYRDQVLQVLVEAAKERLPIWISTRPHEENAIHLKLRKGNEFRKVQIMPFDDEQQIGYLRMISKQSYDECRRQIDFFRENGSKDILENPLHLKMIAELSDFANESKLNLYEIYEKIVEKKLQFALSIEFTGIKLEAEKISARKELKRFAVKYLCDGKSGILKYPKNGIATVTNKRTQFVHQTFAEFLAATHFIDCLFCEDEKMPFDILKEGFHQVRKFVNLNISSSCDERTILLISLEKYLKKSLTKSSLEKVILKEFLDNFSIVAANLVTFNSTNEANELNYVTSDDILALASKNDENFVLRLLYKGAYEKLADPKSTAVKMLAGAIENNFVLLFSKIEGKCANLMELVERNATLKCAVLVAAKRNHHKLLQLVLEKGIIDAIDQDTLQGALKIAVKENSTKCVELLIEHGARTVDLNTFTWDLNIETTEALLKTKDEPLLKLASKIFNRSLDTYNAELAKYLFQKFDVSENADFEVSIWALLSVARWDEFHHNTAEMLCRSLVEKRRLQVRVKNIYGWNAFHFAASAGNLGLVKFFLEKDPVLTETLSHKGENTMHYVFTSHFVADPVRKFEMSKFLLHRDAKMIKQKTAENKTMLHLTAAEGNFDMCKWLVEEIGLEVNAVDDDGWNAMHCAVSNHNMKLEHLEYFHGLNEDLVKQKTKTNKTVLHLAAILGNLILCKWLVEEIELEADTVDDDGWNAMHYVASNHNDKLELLQYFHGLNADLVKQKTKTNITMLHLASASGKLDKCKWLVDAIGLELDAVDDHGLNAMHCAAYSFNDLEVLEIMNYFHNLNADLMKQKTKMNETVLHFAARTGKIDACKWLIEEKSLEIDAVNKNGWNAMHFAASSYQSVELEFLEYLHGLSKDLVKVKTKENETVLHFAARTGNFDACKWLVEEIGLEVCAVDNHGWNVMHFVASSSFVELEILEYLHGLNADLVKQKTIKNETVLHFSAKEGKLVMCKWLVEEIGLEVDTVDDDGWNAMHCAAYYSLFESELMEYLYGLKRVMVKQKTKTNKTVLHVAMETGRLGARECKWLVEEMGLEVDTVDKAGWNAMHFAASSYRSIELELLKYLHSLRGDMVKIKTKTNETVLHFAVRTGKLDACKWLVEIIGLELEAVDDRGWNIMHFAASSSNHNNELEGFEVLEYLHSLNANLVKQKTKMNETVLHFSAKEGKLVVCKWLVEEKGLEVDTVDDDGWNAMHYAASNHIDNLELVEYLHALNADLVKTNTKSNETKLHLAAKEGKIIMCKWLVEEIGLEVENVDENGWNALHCATSNHIDELELVEYLHGVNADLVQQKTKTNETVLHLAAKVGKLITCRWLVELIGQEVDAVDDDGWNAMHCAVSNRNDKLELVEYLHGLKADLVKQKTKTNENVLHLAAKEGKLIMCKWLVEEIGLEVANVDENGWNAMHCAASNRNDKLELVEYLHGLKADLVKQKTKTNENVLHLAAKEGKLIMCKWLVEEIGLEVANVDENGWNAMHCAASNRNDKLELVEYLHGLKADLVKQKTKANRTVLHLAAKAGKIITCRWLVELIGPEVDAVDDDGCNAMHCAASNDNLELLKYLHGLNADLVKQKTKSNKTVLHFAVATGHLYTCKWLVDAIGLEVDAVDNIGWNAMHFAASHYNIELDLFEYLHEKNLQLIEKRTERSETLLHIVTKNKEGKVEIYNWLVRKGIDASVQDSDGKTALQAAHPRFLGKISEYKNSV
ncbi:uncharacterized protein LOC132192631 isoform X2 [Neocloeon triangulifer]|uniref:uncharacterized protein LOC132192631 isoform X2 n=1 Tax=Neocloeon triangulifer TaxID=2078957 RepID=UPI00286F7985|nr:uncharacterized protein LOC132192631 isoform X2 [Neocloeon triangulifer]